MLIIRKKSLAGLIALLFLFISVGKIIFAVEHQQCAKNNTCIIGEFLYDDNYAPMTDASCSLTSKYPNGTTFLNAVAMDAGSDGWYSYSVDTTGHPDGIYPSQVCCDTSESPSQHLCIDKTFTVGQANLSTTDVSGAVWDESTSSHTTDGTFGKNLQNPVLTAQNIWEYSSRTLTSFGSLIDDIWSYTGRSLDSFGTLVADIWSNSTRTLSSAVLSGGGQLAIKSETDSSINSAVASIKGVSNKDLSALSSEVADVQTSVDDIASNISGLQTTVSSIDTNVSSLLTKWGSYSASDIITHVDDITSSFGTNADTCSDDTIFGNIQCVRDKWGSQTADTLYTAANNAYTTAQELQSELDYHGKTSTAYEDLQTLLTNLAATNTSIGTSADTSSTATLFGKLKKNQEDIASVQTTANSISTKVDTLQTSVNTANSNVSTLITKWGAYSASDIMTQLGTVTTRLGTTSDTCSDNTIFGNIQCVRDKWGVQTAAALYTAANNAYTTAQELQSELDYHGKTSTAYEDLQTLKTNLSAANSSIGTSSDTSSTATLFGRLKRNQENIAGVQTTVDSISTKVDTLQSSVNTVNTNVNTLVSKWGAYSISDVITRLDTAATRLGTTTDTCLNNTIFGNIQCIRDKWGSQTADTLYTAANNAYTNTNALRAELDYNGKSTTAYADLQTVKSAMTSLSSSIGSSSDSASASTIFGKIKKVQDTVETLDTASVDVSGLLEKWGDYSAADIYDKVKDISSDISKIDTTVDINPVLSAVKTSSTDITDLKNSVLALKATIDVTQQLVEKTSNKPIVKVWLEEGSIIFKTLITNPSQEVAQNVPLKFYIPREAEKKDIMKIDKGLTIAYDPTEEAYYVSGDFNLAPGETKIFSVEVEDIWKISESQISSVRMQASELFNPLKNTSYFAQGATLKADIYAALDSVNRLQKDAQTPDARIKAYREAMVEFTRANNELKDLRTLVASAGSAGTMFGFIGGIQTLSTWGMIIVLVGGFVFLAIYMRTMNGKKNSAHTSHLEHENQHHAKKNFIPQIAVFSIAFMLSLTGCLFYFNNSAKKKISETVLSPTPVVHNIEKVGSSKKISPEEVSLDGAKDVLGASSSTNENNIVKVVMNEGVTGVNIREAPDRSAKILTVIKNDQEFVKYAEVDGWVEVGINVDKNGTHFAKGWVTKEVISE